MAKISSLVPLGCQRYISGMHFCLLAAASAMLGATTQAYAGGYDPGPPFNKYKPAGYKESECYEDLPGSLFTTGKIQYSCRVTALAHINGSTDPKELFVAIACGRGDTDQMARHNARSRAMTAITGLELSRKTAKQKANLIDQNDYYVSDGMVDHCAGVPSTAYRETVQREGEPATFAPLTAVARPSQSPPPAWEAEGGDEPAPRDSNTATFTIHNNSPYRVGVEFYSQTRDHAWPGGDRQYTVNNDGTYSLNCNAGEKICYGAWRDGNSSVYWGVGMNDKHGCERCCITCGGTFETTLTDNAGSGGGGSGLSDALGAATDILSGAAGVVGNSRRGSGSTITMPNPSSVPNGRSRNPQSTITGGH